MNLYVTGIMGCGKTAAGEKAAEILGVPFFDVDTEVEKQENRPISELFRLHGEAYFRGIETQVLQRLSGLDNAIVSTGGGIILQPGNVELMKKTGKVIWIKRPVDLILCSVDAAVRPLIADNPNRLKEIYAQREPLYKQYADAVVHNTGTLEEAAKEIAGHYILFCGAEE